MDSKELLDKLFRMRAEGTFTNADLARLLSKPTSRVADIFSGKRKVTIDEMKLIVDHYGIGDTVETPNADSIEPLLDAVLPLMPPGRATAESRRALAEAVSYGLELLGKKSASQTSPDALEVASRAAVSRFREKAPR